MFDSLEHVKLLVDEFLYIRLLNHIALNDFDSDTDLFSLVLLGSLMCLTCL